MNCLLCSSEKIKPTVWGGYCYGGIEYRIVSCIYCGFTFVNPMPAEDVIAKMYGDEYFKEFYSNNNGNYIVDSYDNDIKKIKILRQLKRTGVLLDVGCGRGRFLELALKEGYLCSGIEPNTNEAKKVSRLLNIAVYNSILEQANLPVKKFDIIHIGDTLEHVKDPHYFISKIKITLKDDGILMLDLPITYNRNIFNYFLRLNMFFKKNKYSSTPPYHLLEFNRKTIKLFFRKNMISVLKADLYENRPLSFNYIVKQNKIKLYSYFIIKMISHVFSAYLGGKYFGFGDRITIIAQKNE